MKTYCGLKQPFTKIASQFFPAIERALVNSLIRNLVLT
jgi:hypothetical protein